MEVPDRVIIKFVVDQSLIQGKSLCTFDYGFTECFLVDFELHTTCTQSGFSWNQIEMSCRRWAEKYGDVYIVCGPVLFHQKHETIGPNMVVVPEAFFKVVICFIDGRPEGIGYICKNQKEYNQRSSYVNTITEIERITGFTFFPSLPVESAKHAKGAVSPILSSQIQ